MDRRRAGAAMAGAGMVLGIALAGFPATPANAEPAAMLGSNPGECDIARALLGSAPRGCPPAMAATSTTPDPQPQPQPPSPPPPSRRGEPDRTGPLVATPTPPVPAPAVAAPVLAAPAAPQTTERRTAFLIAFDFASTRIRPESQAVLDRVATVMASPEGRERVFRVVGHTDAVGSAAANLALSRRRAAAVVAYLTGTRGVAPERLEALGRGEEDLADPAHPAAAANRRVEIVTLGR